MHALPANATTVFRFYENFYVREHKNRRRKHQTDEIKKVVKTSKFVQRWGIGLNFPQAAMFYRSKKSCDCSVKMYLFGNGDVLVVFGY